MTQYSTSYDKAIKVKNFLKNNSSIIPTNDILQECFITNCDINLDQDIVSIIASGTYGTAVLVQFKQMKNKINSILKIVPFITACNYMAINKYNPIQPENVEWIILKKLRDEIIIPFNFNYIIYPISSCLCSTVDIRHPDKAKILKDFINRVVDQTRTLDNNKKNEYKSSIHFRLTILEYADFATLIDVCNDLTRYSNFQDHALMQIIFQVFMIIAFIQSKLPGFRHNDLHPGNILVRRDKRTCHEYKNSKYSFRIKNYLNISLILNDFDFSEVLHSIKNCKVLALDMYIKYKPKCYDLDFFLRKFFEIFKHKISYNIYSILVPLCPEIIQQRNSTIYNTLIVDKWGYLQINKETENILNNIEQDYLINHEPENIFNNYFTLKFFRPYIEISKR